jgi:purine nucleoside permease
MLFRAAVASVLGLLLCTGQARADAPIPIRVVVVTAFEQGNDTGDEPGELQAWVERLPLPEVVPFPQGFRHLRLNRARGILGIVTGVGSIRASASIMALGMDPRFDLRRAYWLVAGIGGVDPNDASVGSAAWANWLIDGDLAHEIDAREIPRDWTTGYIPLSGDRPYERPVDNSNGNAYRLDPGLVEWAYHLTRGTRLDDSASLRQLRLRYVGFPEAQRPPFVLKGDVLAAMTFWHGRQLNRWANRWIDYWTAGRGNFVMTTMEDTGTAQALTLLDQAGLVDLDRLLVLRTASNYATQYRGISAARSLAGEEHGEYSAYFPSLEAAYRVGQPVVTELTEHWERYRNRLPGG